jgi:hypothetical protein
MANCACEGLRAVSSETMARRRLAALIALVAATAGCGGHHSSVLEQGVQVGRIGGRHVIGKAEAIAAARSASAEWERELRERARAAPDRRFDNLDPRLLRRRLALAARRYGFEVVSIRLLRPRQLAPRIVVRTSRYLELARATPGILSRLDPKAPTADDRTGWRYEGFYFEAQDEHGVPFLLAFNFWRGRGPGGGQWARSEPLYPFEHG